MVEGVENMRIIRNIFHVCKKTFCTQVYLFKKRQIVAHFKVAVSFT